MEQPWLYCNFSSPAAKKKTRRQKKTCQAWLTDGLVGDWGNCHCEKCSYTLKYHFLYMTAFNRPGVAGAVLFFWCLPWVGRNRGTTLPCLPGGKGKWRQARDCLHFSFPKLSMSQQKLILFSFPYSQRPDPKLTLDKPGHKMSNRAVKPLLKVPGAACYCLVSPYCPTTQGNSFSLTNIHPS